MSEFNLAVGNPEHTTLSLHEIASYMSIKYRQRDDDSDSRRNGPCSSSVGADAVLTGAETILAASALRLTL